MLDIKKISCLGEEKKNSVWLIGRVKEVVLGRKVFFIKWKEFKLEEEGSLWGMVG